MEIEFNIIEDELIMSYSPSNGTRFIFEHFSKYGYCQIKRTFYVNKDLIKSNIDDSDSEETLSFCIGHIQDGFIEINKKVIDTKHRFFFSEKISLKYNMFIAEQNTSILAKIDQIIDGDFYVVDKENSTNGVPVEAYLDLIKCFPKKAEIMYYVQSRISNLLKEWLPECDKYQEIYDKHIDKKNKQLVIKNKEHFSRSNNAIELAQFSTAKEELEEMLLHPEGVIEKEWQKKIHSIIQLLYPQYIYGAREIRFKGIDKNDKQPDFILVDTNGFVDILEIKNPDVRLITKQASYRNNYVPVKELSGAVQQIEKYIYCLTSIENSQKTVLEKLRDGLPEGVNPQVVSPKGMLLIGRSKDFNEQQKRDFEIIKRQYKNIADIMTYDDLLKRISNIVSSLVMKNR